MKKKRVKKKETLILGMLILAIPIFSNISFALIIDAQPTTKCDLFDCETKVDLSKYVSASAVNSIKALNISSLLPKVKCLDNLNYRFSGSEIILNGRIKEDCYWTLPLGSYATIDPWWNNSFSKCKNISVSNGLSGHPSFINVTYDSDMVYDFRDIRFINTSCNNGGYELSHFMRNSSASQWATYDLKLDGTQNISMYYNESTAVSHSSLTNVWGINLVAYYPEDECGGNIVNDVANNLDMLLVGGSVWNSTKAKFGCAVNFTGANKMTTSDNPLLDITTNITLMGWLWINAINPPNDECLFAKRWASGVCNYQYTIGESGVGDPHFYNGVTDQQTNNRASSGVWVFAWALIDGVNGTLIQGVNTTMANTSPYSLGSANSINLTIGNSGYGDAIVGIFDEPKIFNNTIDPSDIINKYYASVEPTFTFGSEQTGAVATAINLWINNGVGNITTSCGGENNNYSANIDVTGLNVSIMYKNVGTGILYHGNTNTSSVSWYASLIAGLWNITANYTGNDTYLGSGKTLFHTITLGNPDDVSILFNTTPSGNNTTCLGVPLNISCGSYDLEDGVLLYNDSANISNPYYFTPSATGVITYRCNWTTGDCFNGGNVTRQLEVLDCGTPTANISCSAVPENTIYTLVCSGNNTLRQSWTFDSNVCYAYQDCLTGCDNITLSCKPPKYQSTLYLLGIIVIGAILVVWVRRRL